MRRISLDILVAPVLLATLTACGGGGESGESEPPPVVYYPALEFNYPDRFQAGDAYSTTATTIRIQGELNSVSIPRGYCPDRRPPQDYTLRWTNGATGDSGTSPIAIGCVTNYLFGIELNGIASSFLVYPVALALGDNPVTFETFSGGTKIGEDRILIVNVDRTNPTVSFHYPAADAMDVPGNHAIVVQFDEAMDAGSLAGDRLALMDSLGNTLSGEYHYEADSFTFSFRPDGELNPLETYSVLLAGEVQDLGGNPLEAELAWSFSTGAAMDTTPLQLESRWPGTGCDCASPSTRILARFHEVSDPASIAAGAMMLRDQAGTEVAGTVTWAGDFIEFKPASSLARGQTYSVAIKAGIRDLAGLGLATDLDWQFTTTDRAPDGTWYDTADAGQVPAMSHHSAVWTGTDVLFWGWEGGGIYTPSQDSWWIMDGLDAPSPRGDHSATWTGTEMIVWGGRDGDGTLNDGGIYDPASDTWLTVSSPLDPDVGATSDHVAVWTGTELIVWGGIRQPGANAPRADSNRGFRFDPLTDSWTEIANDGPLSPRHGAAFVWTGTELIVWGGKTIDGDPLADGARYDPASDTWTILPDLDSPQTSRASISAVWTGAEMIVWNGGRTEPDQYLNDRYRESTLRFYDPATDTWRRSGSGWEPFVATGQQPALYATGFSAWWTGDAMFVIGKSFGDGAWFFDPAGDSWRPASTTNAPFSVDAAAGLWAGDRYIEWGGIISVLPRNEGKYYLPR